MGALINSRDWLDKIVEGYDHPAIILFRSIELKTISQNLENLQIKSPILDLGCGEGRIAKALFGRRLAVGLDNSLEEIKKARTEQIYELLISADATRLPFDDGKLRMVFSNCVIEHIEDNANVLLEVSRVLKPQGLFLFTVPSENFGNYLYFTEFFKKLGLSSLADRYRNYRNKMLNHYHCYGPQEWERRLNRAGLKLVRYQYYMSRDALKYWDLLALEIVILRTLIFWLPEKRLLRWLGGFWMNRWKKKIEYYYNFNNQQDGGALLVIAQKVNK